MEIDLFTVVAQIANFIILLLLLKHLLYGRIIKAMDEREEMIASRLREAEEEKSKAEERHRSVLQKEEDFDKEREEKLREAVQAAESKKKEMTAAARQDAEESRKRWLESVERQKESFLRDLKLRSGREIYAVARKALKDLADRDLEGQIVLAFIARLEQLEDDGRKEIAELARSSGEKVTIRSSFQLDQKMKKSLTSALKARLGEDVDADFEVSGDLVGGIELKAGDRRVSWNLDSYLSTLEDRVSVALEEGEPGGGRKKTDPVSE